MASGSWDATWAGVAAISAAVSAGFAAVTIAQARKAGGYASDANRHAAEANKLSQRLLKMEEDRDQEAKRRNSKASVTVTLKGNCLHLTNEGPAAARSIALKLDGYLLGEHPNIGARDTSLDDLDPGGTQIIGASQTLGSSPIQFAEITWQDASGDTGSWNTQLQ
jgi:hypothetical protein